MRIHNLTGVRAVAALWVVLYHLQTLRMNLHLDLGQVVRHGEFGVDLFFVLSGFVLTLVYGKNVESRWTGIVLRRFLLRRFAKIYPLHMLTLLLTIALFKAGEHSHYTFTADTDNSSWTALCNLLMVHAWGLTAGLSWNKPSWSVSAEWFAYAVLFVPMVTGLARVRLVTLVVISVSLVAVMGFLSLRTGHSWTSFTTNGVWRILPDFLCGYTLYRVMQRGRQVHGDLLSCAGVSAVVLACYLPHGDLWLLLPGVMTLLAGLYAGGPLVNRIFGNHAVVSLGDASYSIYLLQTVVLIATKQVVLRFKPADTALVHGLLTIGVLCTAAVSGLLCFRYVEEPLRKAILRHFQPRTANPERMPQSRSDQNADTEMAAVIG